MTRRARSCVAVFILAGILVFEASVASAAERGFFTGRRGEVIALLAGASRPNISRDDAMAVVVRARAASAGLDDPYLDFFIAQTLSEIYRDLGDSDASSAQHTAALEQFAVLMRDDGPAQTLYTLYLMGYDLQRPMATIAGGESTFEQLQQVEAEVAAALEEIETALQDPELSPGDRAELRRFHAFLEQMWNDFSAGLVQNDARKLRRARRGFVRFFDDMQKAAKASGELTEEDEKVFPIFRDVTVGMIDMVIAGAGRKRRAFEKSARSVADGYNRLVEMGVAEVEEP